MILSLRAELDRVKYGVNGADTGSFEEKSKTLEMEISTLRDELALARRDTATLASSLMGEALISANRQLGDAQAKLRVAEQEIALLKPMVESGRNLKLEMESSLSKSERAREVAENGIQRQYQIVRKFVAVLQSHFPLPGTAISSSDPGLKESLKDALIRTVAWRKQMEDVVSGVITKDLELARLRKEVRMLRHILEKGIEEAASAAVRHPEVSKPVNSSGDDHMDMKGVDKVEAATVGKVEWGKEGNAILMDIGRFMSDMERRKAERESEQKRSTPTSADTAGFDKLRLDPDNQTRLRSVDSDIDEKDLLQRLGGKFDSRLFQI